MVDIVKRSLHRLLVVESGVGFGICYLVSWRSAECFLQLP